MRYIDATITKDPLSTKHAESFAKAVASMVTSSIEEISCEKVAQLATSTDVSLVYFGSKESLQEGGSMAHLIKVAEQDQFMFPGEWIQFYYTTDVDCKK